MRSGPAFLPAADTMRALGIILAGLTVLLGLPAPASAEIVDSTRYRSWARHLPGTSISRTSEVRSGPDSLVTDVKQTLIEVTPEKVVVEVEVTFSSKGQVSRAPPRRVEFPARVEKYSDLLSPEIRARFGEERMETVEVLGESVECRVIDFEGTQSPRGGGAPIKVSGTIWISEQIPDATVQLIQNAQQSGPDGQPVVAVTYTAVASKKIRN
ncbi:MAG: hypothetical protein NZ561_07040 [Phycisphaerae bacterium]|nr:hypothetical protein [Phycisphaerae bacterium]MDW8262961.1 hypothetical protein [Phycisphaerales bacterium]